MITAPAEIDTSTVGELRVILFEWQSRGHTTIVVDLTDTQFCDSAGLRELVWAHKRAVADGGGLRLVIAAEGAVARIFTVTGLDAVIPRFATVGQALAQVAAATRSLNLREHSALVADSRRCEQCGAAFVPRREHARFCSGECRAAWNRAHLGDPAVDASALAWSIAAMSEATGRLAAVKIWNLEQAFAAIGEAVWWITMVDATLVRHHSPVYDAALASRPQAECERIEQTLAGLRFVRNWSSREGAIGEAVATGAGSRRITGWTWKPITRPALAWLPPRAQAWELVRWRAYHARLAGCAIGKTFGLATAFLTVTGADPAVITETS